MTTPRELDHEKGARFIEKLLAEDPAKLCVATDEQVDAMMDAAGIEAGEPDTVEQMLARVERRRRERATQGAAPVPRAAEPGPRAAPKKPPSRGAWVAGAAVAAAAATVVAVQLAGSRRGPDAIGPEPPSSTRTPHEQAARLREEALAACDARDFAVCTVKLDDARTLDPAGESEGRVVAARAAIAASQEPTQEPPGPPEPLKPR
ncbi:MAG TPA: hypothetical protein VIJ22_20250 [Polyangiaceae bacterium]